MKNREDVYRVSLLSMFLAISIVVSIIESFIPLVIPSVRIGFANIFTLVILYTYGAKDALFVLILRILLVGLLRGTFMSPTFYLSISGALLSFTTMFIFSRTKIFSVLGVSLLGSLAHGIGQVIMAVFILDTSAILIYIQVTIAISIPAGIITGLLAIKILSMEALEINARQ